MNIDTVKEKNVTAKKIFAQPQLWVEVHQKINENKKQISEFLSPLLERKELKIVLTGAGSSAFIGEAAQGLVQKNTGRTTMAIATTDLVSHPELYMQAETPSLLVSFARSGNSPESLETIKLADHFCREVYHLMITCNKEGELMEYSKENPHKSLAILLPEKANDKSLAMTGSFTSMLLSILLATSTESNQYQKEIETIVAQGKTILSHAENFEKLASRDFERVVFLGSGPMLGIARECHLKLQELTDGQVICKHDSFLGFRHGPRAVTNEKTLQVYLFSPSAHVYKYELDLAQSIAKDPRNLECVSLGRPAEPSLRACLNISLDLKEEQELNIIPAALVGQLLGYYKSLELGLNPDNPSISGSISRVVQGVTIYKHPHI